MSQIEIDLYSDTISRPGPAMRQAMANAEVGNEQADEDPTVNELCARVATLLGKEAAMFLPSGTMCNQISYRVHCQPGDEIILDATGHALHAELGGTAALSGAMTRPLNGERGIFTAEQVAAAVRPLKRNQSRSRVVSVENTCNFGGGSVWPLENIQAVAAVAKEHGLAMHMDGARLLNAVVAGGVSAADYAAPFDTVWIDLSKGLGCPVGGVLAASHELIAKAWPFKHQFGGAMRQAGIIAAAGIYALDHHIDRLADDHANAKIFANWVGQSEGLTLAPGPVETNIVVFDCAASGRSADTINAHMQEKSVRFSVLGPTTLRAVTHIDVDAEKVDKAGQILKNVMAGTG